MPESTAGFFQRLLGAAREAAARKNNELAIMYYQQALMIEPNAVDVRRELRAVADRNAKEKGASRWLAWLQGAGTFLRIFFAGDPEQKMNLCEKFLAGDPRNVRMLVLLADSAQKANYPETAIAILEDLRAEQPRNTAALRRLLELYRTRGEIDVAIQVAEKLRELVPEDVDVDKALRDLAAEKTSKVYATADHSGTARAVMDQEKMREVDIIQKGTDVHDEQEAAERLALLQKKVSEAPNDPRNWVSLGDLLRRLSRWDEARQAYQEARRLNPIEYTYVMRLEDNELRQAEAALQELARRARAGDAAAAAELPGKQVALLQYRLDSFLRREKQYPMDLKIPFDLAHIFFELGQWDQAIVRYQRTQNDPENREASKLRLGLAFQQKSEFELALRTFTDALNSLETHLMNEMRKQLLYERGCCQERLGHLKPALEDYMAIYEKDIAFRDVQQRVREVRQRLAQAPAAGAA